MGHLRITELASALLITVASCTAATRDEGSGQTTAAVGEAETGFKCSATNIAMPKDLPDVEACINDEAGGTGPDTGCNGWAKVGPYATSSDELRSAVSFGAQLYSIEPDSDTLCLYLYRGNRKTTGGSLNGVHCYNKTTCDVCWWDGASEADKKPTASILKHEAADGSDCSDCHRNGPLLPKLGLWEALKDTTQELHAVCSGAGGASWKQAPKAWPLKEPDPKSVLDAPTGCGASSCHENGFSKGGSYCTLVKHAFADDKGSMRGAGKKFRTQAACEKFRDDMGCDTADIPCDSADVVRPAATGSSSSSGGSSSGGDEGDGTGDDGTGDDGTGDE